MYSFMGNKITLTSALDNQQLLQPLMLCYVMLYGYLYRAQILKSVLARKVIMT